MNAQQPPFVHLHVHTEYSLLDGAIRIDALIQRAVELEMPAVAITDHGTMFGVLEFYQKALAAGIKPIIGCECYVAPRSLNDKTPADHKGLSHLVLLAENSEGYRNLCRLATAAQLEGFYYKPRIDKVLLKDHSSGLIALSGCLKGEIPTHLRHRRFAEAEASARFFQELFGCDRFFLEIQANGLEEQAAVNDGLKELSRRLSIPVVATNDCHYLHPDDVRAHDVLLCIQTGKTVNDTERLKFRTDQLYFKSPAEMAADFQDCPEALHQTLAIAERCNIEFDFNTYHFPRFETPQGQTVDAVFEETVRAGFDQRIKDLRQKQPDLNMEDYQARLEREIAVIKDMGFCGYFLIVADFIQYAKNKGIPVGPGRGSAAGSLVAYALRITDLDPLAHGLIFERFLNPARKSMPDIDVDFCINGREEVFKYVVDKYGGGDYVAQIITFGKLKTRAVIRDVGRALDIPLREVDTIAKMVPDVLNISLEKALAQEPRLAELAENDPAVGELIQICRVLEGLPRHASTHAAGVVIADKPLVDYMPLYKGKKGEVVTQFDMKQVEKIGLVKFDFLGLRNLTVIADTVQRIALSGAPVPDLSKLDMADADTYRLLASGETAGVFQLESAGMRDLLVRLKPESFEDIIALVALYRPGPMESGMIDDYVECKHGNRAVEYLVPDLEPVLQETYGVIVYQEQVMKIAGKLAKYSMAEADDLRKAMGKKIPAIMAQHRERFAGGARENGISASQAQRLFELIEKFGGYGFNKSHSAAYALIAYQTAYLKAHYPLAFMAALLTSEMHSTDGVVKYIAECRSRAIPVMPPDINESEKAFTVSDEKIRFGLLAVKNVGEGAIESMLEARADRPFESLLDFCERVDLKKVNRRVVESLIKCGAFDSLNATRASLMGFLDEALDFGQQVQRKRSDPQMELFDCGAASPPLNQPVMAQLEEWEQRERLALEKEHLGFYITGHPLMGYERTIEKYATVDSITLQEAADGAVIRMGGVVQHVKSIITKKGEPMAFLTMEDLHGGVEITVFSDLYVSVRDLLAVDRAVFVQGTVQRDENAVKVVADSLIAIERVAEEWTANVCIDLDAARTAKEKLVELSEILKRYPGSCSTFLNLRMPGRTEVVISLPASIRVQTCEALVREVNGTLGYTAFRSVCAPPVKGPGNGRRKGRHGGANGSSARRG